MGKSNSPQEKPNYLLITAIIATVGAVITAIISYFGSINQVLVPIEFTQTAEALHTSIAMTNQGVLIPLTDTPAISSATEAPSIILSATPTMTSPTPAFSGSWCDNFDDGMINQIEWIVQGNSEFIFEQNGVLNLQITTEKSQNGGAWAGLEATPPGKSIREIVFWIVLQSGSADFPSGAGIDVFMKDAEPVYSVDIGPYSPPSGEFTFCPNYDVFSNDGYFGCEHPTPIPDQSAFRINIGIPIEIRVVASGTDISFELNHAVVSKQSVAGPIDNFEFFVYSDPGGAIHAEIDNACVTYIGDS